MWLEFVANVIAGNLFAIPARKKTTLVTAELPLMASISVQASDEPTFDKNAMFLDFTGNRCRVTVNHFCCFFQAVTKGHTTLNDTAVCQRQMDIIVVH